MAANYVKTAYADIQTDDVVIITMQNANGVYAASNDQGSSKAPVATEVTVADDAITTDATNILWTVVKDGDNITFKVGDDALYCTNTNNGMRVGSNSNNVFSIDATSGYLFNNATNRYIGVYNNQDFRCYGSVNSNIKDQTLAFFVLDEGGDPTPTLENGFYLVGTMNGWTPAAEYHFTGNPENPAEFMLATTLSEGQELKVGNVVNNEITAWYPGGDNYVVDAAHAGEKTIYFQPDYKADWSAFGGYFYIAANEVEPQPAAVVLPATLDVTNVSFRSEGMPDFVIEEGQEYAGTYFDMGAHDSSNDTLLYAEWNVTIQPIKYNVAVDVYNTNSWRVQLYLLNQAGDTLKSLRYKGSSGQKGQFAIGSLDLSDLEAGDYKVRAHAATAWSAMKLKDVIFAADYQGVAVELPGTLQPAYAELSSGASVANNAIAFAPSTANNEYATWNVSFAEAGSYNVTIDITASNGHNYGVALLSADGTEEVAAVNEGGQKGDTGVKELGAIAVPEAGNYKVKLTNATQWSEAVLNSITFAVAPAAPKYYLVGSMTEWNVVADEAHTFAVNPENDAEYMLNFTLAENDAFKVVKVEGESQTWYPEGMDNNYTVDAAHAGEKTIYFRPDGQGGEGWHYGVIYVAANEEPVVVELQAVSEATAWDFTKITANTENALYSSNGIKLTDSSTPAKNEEVVYANYSADFMTFAEGFDATTMAFQGEYPIRENKYCQAGTLHFKTTVAGTITVKFSDTGSSASATAVKRYLVVNGEQTEYWTSRPNNGEEPYEAQLNVTSGEIAVPAGDVTITGSSAIRVSNITFAPKVEEPAKFYITGDAALVGEELAWNPAAIKSTETSYNLNLAAGDYKLKVTLNGAWEPATDVKGFDALTTTADGLTADEDGNICFTLAEAGEVNVHYDGEFFYLNGDFYVAPVVVKYYLKNNWGSEAWSWKEMTDLGDGTYMLYNVVVGGEGVNRNTAESDEGASWFTWADIETFDASFEPATIGALDTVVIYFDPEAVNSFTGANGMSAQILGKYVAPVEEIKYCEFATGHLKDPNFGDANGRILLTIQKIADSNNIRVAIKNNAAAGNTKAGLNYLWVNAEGATNNNATYGSHEAEDVEEVSVIVEFNEAKESYNFLNIHWAYAGWGGEWAIDGLTVNAAELCEASAPIVELNYYMKNNWDAVSDWTWKAMTKDGETYKLENVVFGGTGVNYNTAESDEGSSWVPVANIAGDAISAKDTVTLVLDPAAGTVTATLIGKYNDPNPGEHTYTVAGNSTAAFGTAWDPAEAHNDMVLNGVGIYLWEKTELTLPAGTIEFKVCEDHAWDVAYPASNYQLAIPEAGVYTIYIAFNPETKEVSANATKTGDATVTVDYYLVGSVKGWEAKAENIFTLNAEAGEGIEEYVIETTLEVGEGLKVVSSTDAWYPEGTGNEYVVDQNHAGATTIYFRPAYNEEWAAFGGYMYVVPTGTVDIDAIDANAPAVKVLRNGQIFIIKGGKTYNVMGAIVR